MPVYLDRKRNTLYIEFQYKGHRQKTRLLPGTTRKEAELIEVKIKNDLMFQSHGIYPHRDITFNTFIREFYNPVLATFSPDRLERTLTILKAVAPFLTGKQMRSIKAADLERFKASRANLLTIHGTIRKPATIEREMAIISSIFTMAVKNDVIDYNPCSRVTRLKFDNTQDKILRREDEDKFFANMHSPWARDVCKMVLNTTLRQNDLMSLTRFQVDRNNKVIALTQGKTKRRVIIPLNSVALEILERHWHNGNKYLFPSPKSGDNHGSVRHAMMRACARAGIPPLTIRDLRRTCATRMIEDGADVASVASILGHADLRMLQRYVRSMDSKRKAVDSLVLNQCSNATSPPTALNTNVESIDKKRVSG